MPDDEPTNPGAPVSEPRRHQPISMQQAIAAAIVTALLGGGIGAGGGITLGSNAHNHDDYVRSTDLARVESKVDKLDGKVEALDAKMVDLRIALAGRGISAPASP